MTREGARAPRRRSTKTAMKRKVDDRGKEMTREDIMRGRRSGGGGEVASRRKEGQGQLEPRGRRRREEVNLQASSMTARKDS